MKDLMKTNIYDCSDEIIVVGSCLKSVQPESFKELEDMKLPMFDLCLEQTHINMAITKLLGMLRAKKIKRIIFASVDRSPHCTQMHYIQDEILKLGFDIKCENYVSVDNKLVNIDRNVISTSKNLAKLNQLLSNNN